MESKVAYEDNRIENVITKKDLNKMVWHSFFLQSSFNYERMQGCGWLYSIIPGLRKIHKNKEELSESMKLHMEVFNTHPFLVTFIMGIVISMEEARQDKSSIKAIKLSTMGPLGGIGDSLFWLTILPICAGIGVSLGSKGSILGPVVFLVLFNILHLAIRFRLMHYGYNTGIKALASLKENTKKLSRAASIVGLTVLGGLVAAYINLSTTLVMNFGEYKLHIQADVLDKVLLKTLPLAYTFFMYYLLKKGYSPTKLIGITIVIGVLGRLLNIL